MLKKHCALFLAILTLAMIPTMATAEDKNVLSGRWGVGYQGLASQSSYYLNGVSIRSWFNDDFGAQGTLFYYNSQQEKNKDTTQFIATIKGMYSPIVSKHSRFFIGAELGGGNNAENGKNTTMFLVRPSFGAEFGFSEIPDLGFNFDVGYTYSTNDRKGSSENDSTVDGTSVSCGVAYYF